MLSVIASKSLVLGVLFVMTFGLGLIPVKLMTVIQHSTATCTSVSDGRMGRRTRLAMYKRILSFLSCFAAGVFLATCFLDLLPSVRKHMITVLFEMDIITGFPLAEFIMSIGLFLILIVEQIVLLMKEGKKSETEVKKPLLGKHNGGTGSEAGSDQDDKEEFLQSDHSIRGISDQPDINNDRDIDPESSVSPSSRHRGHADHHHHGHHHEMGFQNHSPLRAMLLLSALSLHSIFEGLSVGLQSNAGQVLGIFAALVLHKSILSFSIGMSLVQSRLSTKSCIRSILFFSLTAPFGVGVGILMTDLWESNASNLVDGILQGIASGTFLYMTFFEVLPAELNSSHDRMLKLLMLLLGYSTVTCILFLSDSVKAPFCKVSVGHS